MEKSSKAEVLAKPKITKLDVLDALESYVYPDELDVVISRANTVKKRLLEDEIKAGDTVIISPTKSSSMHAISRGRKLKVDDVTSEGLLVITINGQEGSFTRDKVLLMQESEEN